jgi:hypothetical protein
MQVNYESGHEIRNGTRDAQQAINSICSGKLSGLLRLTMADEMKSGDSEEGKTRDHRNSLKFASITGLIAAVVTAAGTVAAAFIGANAPHPPEQKPNIFNNIKIGFQVMSGSEPKTTLVEAPLKTPTPESKSTEFNAADACLGLNPKALKVEQAVADSINPGAGGSKGYSVDITLRNVSQQAVSLIAIDPVVITDDQKDQLGIQHTTLMKVNSFRTDETSATNIFASGMRVDPDVAMTINFTFLGASQTGHKVSISVPLGVASIENAKALIVHAALGCRDIPVR